jgi:A/G-specific adenine glycosylase
VLALWSGLGYYSRARNLHRCAQAVVQVHGGAFPAHSAVLATLPGIGRSTAAAIAAFCFGERAAILDGNVKRVLTRALGFDDDLASAAAQKRLWAEAEALLPRRDVDVYTQGLMDLGATLCTQRRPACASLPAAGPLRGACPGAARALSGQDAQAQAQPACQRLAVAHARCTGVAGAAAAHRRVGRAVEPA